MPNLRPSNSSSRASYWIVAAIVAMIAIPAALTLHTVHVAPVIDPAAANSTPYGYTVSLLLFIVPIVVIACWFLPQEKVRISRKSFWWTIGLLFPLGALLDFFFAHAFFTYANPGATLRIAAPALHGGVPAEEYIFYFTGFVAVLLFYIWFDEYWLAAYTVPVDSAARTDFARLLRFHPQSAVWAIALIAAALIYRKCFVPEPGFPGYFIFLVLVALTPSMALLPTALPVINWRALSLTVVVMLLISLLWDATLGVPYGWWGFQASQMIGIHITAWSGLPIEEVFLWIVISYATVIVYETVRRWKASGKRARHAFLGIS
jgi:lycopene cyclase domain-containing protein